ncbi:putative isochorismatase family hydrolase [Talaromyces proteolyticus]|uniref:Isochorismatase family hydrolase n=1 Tax=Talaromyces proteolyticus TaxID=1131652 RepID=A0AAD4KT24_9EURO|nr:putative isochorismatase family hydrolase [Talaromyces proteolyticus]KAH8696071.1 putative isochorismatase family hydrolase [Talaromyces proteolyticus]
MAALAARATRIRNPALFICDIQEKFRDHIYEFSKVVSTSQKLLKASSPLKIPVYVTTQNRTRLGDTVSELQPYLSSNNVIADVDKTLFSMITPEVLTSLQNNNNTTSGSKVDAILVGIETHICITQTALDLLERGHRVYVLADGVSSVNAEERGVALARLRDIGVTVTTSESIIFEILQDSKNEGFKAVNSLVKETKDDTREALKALCNL